MINESDDGRKYDALTKLFLGEQDGKQKEFEMASDANYIKEDVGLSPEFSDVTDIRQTRINFLVQHTPSTLINWWSINTGPRALKTGIEGWVAKLNEDDGLQKLLQEKDRVTDKLLAIQELLNNRTEQNNQSSI